MYAYMAHPIDQAKAEVGHELRPMLRAMGWPQPLGQWWPAGGEKATYEGRTPAAIAQYNRQRQQDARGTFAFLPEGVPSLGVPVEIERAIGVHKHPVAVVVHPGAMHSVQLHEWTAAGAFVTTSLHQAVEWFVDALGMQPGAPVPEPAPEANEEPRSGERWQAVAWLHDGTPPQYAPHRHHPGDAGFDLYVSQDVDLGPGQSVNVPCGWDIELPIGWWALVTGRSSTLRDRGLLVVNGIIDQGYTGPMFCTVQNLGNGRVPVRAGERLAQLVPLPVFDGDFVTGQRSERPPVLERASTRGANGFGSTGR